MRAFSILVAILAGPALAADPVNITQDIVDEGDETVTFGLDAPSGASISGTVVHTLTIQDDDPTPALTVTSPSVLEDTGR